MFTPEAISRKTFRRLTKQKATLARETERGKNCWNYAWFEENVSVPVSWEGKHEEHSMCVSESIDSDNRSIYRERSTVVCVPIRSVTVHPARKGFQECVVFCQLRPTLVYFAVLQPGLFSYIVQSLLQPSVKYLRHSADLPLTSVQSELSSVCCQKYFDVIHYWPWIFCFLRQLQ